MMILDGAGVLLNQPITINSSGIYLPTASASLLPEVVMPQVIDLSYIGLIIAILSLLATFFAALAAYLSYKTARDTFTNDILMKFFEISSWLPKRGGQVSPHQKQHICNYFDFVCFWLERGKVSKKDIEPLRSVMKTPIFVTFATQYRQRNGNLFFDYYWRWLQANP